MYGLFSEISAVIGGPFNTLSYIYADNPFLFALFLGLIGAVAPCQLTGNISALTFYGSRTLQSRTDWLDVGSFIAGKVVAFTGLGLFAWLFGQTFQDQIIDYFPAIRKAVGPLIVLGGLVMLGIFKLRWVNRLSARIPQPLREGRIGSFLMGVTFSIAFCPTMFVLFFLSLIPTVLDTSYGLVLPAVFGVATSLPLLIVLGVMEYLHLDRRSFKTGRKVGAIIQKSAGVFLVVIGLLDTVTYWTY
ncbi:Cytochrome c biogenesis protein CcdA [Bhargavaea ginsengi]|uniref:Cytochrome c biogenesis protein CcdA n=1 Tax=Bhargavaea ginsengi TaxID=426757 RepID=A0A1H7BQD5_9BACL|nr:sulfite exporter TauE/SafE family protein [Bhargavaea ginsengi]MCM3089007.1 sulfite exporter TauE/SafE family protein [Bhargavaea ginsengi]SEJ79688.1 Cytochrome c biogenesis protein CcdA [Bhargavaea ginsengi]